MKKLTISNRYNNELRAATPLDLTDIRFTFLCELFFERVENSETEDNKSRHLVRMLLKYLIQLVTFVASKIL